MKINRDYYLNQLISGKNNGLIKFITGLRRCGKSYLLLELFREYLIESGVNEDCILVLTLEDAANARYRNPVELDSYIRQFTQRTNESCYILIDDAYLVREIENPWLKGSGEMIGFSDVCLGLMKIKNADIYLTFSNCVLITNDIITRFGDKGHEIHLHPLCYSEVIRAYSKNPDIAWREYITYGGLPHVVSLTDRRQKVSYLCDLFEKTYLGDVLDRHGIKNDKSVLKDTMKIAASSVGAFTNPKKISENFTKQSRVKHNQTTVDNYLQYFTESYVIRKAFRYDVKGRRYLGTPLKYYFSDIGIRNAILDFRQQEENCIMENIIYNELLIRGYSVDVGVVEHRYREMGKDIRSYLQVDFIATRENGRIYVQSALNVDTIDKRQQETAALLKINNSFKKIVVVKDSIIPWTDDDGISYVGVRDFLSGRYPDMEPV